jgi:hypothetical protein
MKTDDRSPRRFRRRRAIEAFALTLLCAGFCLSCSDDPTVDVTTQCLDFVAAEGTPSGNVVLRKSSASSCNFLVLDLVATDIEGIYSAEVTVEYATAVAAIFMFEVGPLLLTDEGDGSPASCGSSMADYGVACQATGDFASGSVDISISRIVTTWGTNTADAGPEGAVLGTLTFSQLTLLAGANGPVSFPFGKLLNAEMEPQNILDVNDPANGTFLGGQFVIVTQ